VKIPVTEQIVKYSDRPDWHQQPGHVKSPFFAILTFSLEFGRLSWPGPHP